MKCIFLASILVLGCYLCITIGNEPYIDNHIIPEGYIGWLVVRETAQNKTRPKVVNFEYDQTGFCITNFNLDQWKSVHYFYKNSNGKMNITCCNYEENYEKQRIYAWAMGNHGKATSAKYLGERWHVHFVGQIEDYNFAIKNEFNFMQRFNLYDSQIFNMPSQSLSDRMN